MTMHLTRSLRLAAAVLLVPSLLAGCAGKGGGVKDTSYVARDVDTLYLAAQNRLERGQYKVAAALFDEVERQHPYSPWARRAQLMSAYSYWLAQDHTKSIDAANRFLSIHPGNRDAPYASYLVALNYYEQISDIKRDQKTTRDALNALGEVMRRYPDTRYAADAKLKIDLVNDHLAGKEMEVGRYYERAGDWLAASLRFREVVDNYQTTSHTAEALFRLTESYLSLGIPDQAKASAAVLGANYPGSKWYKRAFDLMQKHAPDA
ncbi:outer membrane protein assembly factor BamD [Sphingorhabdus soli]|uniref:Outer membrane protein assembly factor BamD n=1 Tax=Flavisphingopyxis soli TaxID=2601267 RepID=A0A5C6U908_9SPHN|nr:outer membrane protein assembly factor BamD [Sphingorhabdus soli]TXC68286.1 outer membrane protein assembly factor BamD [Sphingorhabdus soli]